MSFALVRGGGGGGSASDSVMNQRLLGGRRLKHLFLFIVSIFLFSLFFNACWEAFPEPEPASSRLWLQDVNDNTLSELLAGSYRSDHNSRPCESGDCNDLHKNKGSCSRCANLTLSELRTAHPTVYSRTRVDCPALLQGGNDGAVKAAKDYLNEHGRDPHWWTAGDYIRETRRNCSQFRRMRGYISQPLSQEEADFPIAFSILMYSNVQQVERLLRAIYMPQNYYCIHVDKKATAEVQAAMTAITDCFDNVFVASRLESVYWGHISIIYAEMSCMRDLLQTSDKWKYFINLSGQMFPAHSNAELVRILRLYNGSNDIEGSFKRSDHFWLTVRQKLIWRLSTSTGMMFFTFYSKTQPPYNVTLYKGSNQVAVTREFVIYFLYHPMSQNLIEWFADTLAPDEYIWPTINHNIHLHAPGGYKGDPELKPFTARATIWNPMLADQAKWSWDDWDCRGKWVREICIFGVGDLPWLSRRPELFINKFHSEFEWLTYDCLEELIFNKTVDNSAALTFDPSYYLRLPFVVDRSLVTSVNETIQFLRRSDVLT